MLNLPSMSIQEPEAEEMQTRGRRRRQNSSVWEARQQEGSLLLREERETAVRLLQRSYRVPESNNAGNQDNDNEFTNEKHFTEYKPVRSLM